MNLKEKLKKLFIEKLPNTLLIEHIRVDLSDISRDALQGALNELVNEGFLDAKTYPNTPYSREGYNVRGDVSAYPISFETNLGPITIPRLIDRDVARGEDINAVAKGLSIAFDRKISELKDAVDKENKKYWASLATIFGLFITIFSMVNIAIKPIYFSEQLGLSPQEQFLQTIYNLGPLAGVLIIFTMALWLILKK